MQNGRDRFKKVIHNIYLKYTFSFMGDEDFQKRLWVVCAVIVSSVIKKPSILIRQLETKHAIYKQKYISFFPELPRGFYVAYYVFPTYKKMRFKHGIE